MYYHLGPKTAHLVCQVQLESSRCIMLEGAPPSKAYESAPNEYVGTTPIQTFRYINKPVQEAGVVYRYLDRPSTRLSHGHVDVINEPYHSYQRLLVPSVDEDPTLSALVHETEYDDTSQQKYRGHRGIMVEIQTASPHRETNYY